MPTHAYRPILPLHAQTLANHFAPDWALHDPDNLRVQRGECAQWRYVGTDPDLEDAKLLCVLTQARGAWRWAWFGGCAAHDRAFYPIEHLRGTDQDRYLTTITVSPTRPLAQIAHAVQRRLLPRWLPMYAKARRAWREAQREEVTP